MRPTILHVGGVLYWTIQTRNPDTMVLKDADSTPSVAVRKNGASVGDSVTITKRSATTGLYDCSYNPAAEVEGDSFQFEESAAVTGTTTSSATYVNQFSVQVRALERGTDGALQPTIASRTLNVSVDGEGDAVLNSEYLFDDGFGRKAVNANVTHYQGTLQGNGDLPAKLDAIRTNTNIDIPASINDLPTNAELAAALDTADDAVLLAVAGVKSDTGIILPAQNTSIYNRIGAPAGVSISADLASVKVDTGTTIPSLFTTLTTKIKKFFQLSLRKDAAIATDNAAELTELNASGGSGVGSYLSTTDSQEAIRDSIAGVISSAIASAGVATTVTGIPTFLRVGDARTVANGGAIAVRLYDADDDSLLFGLGTQLFADATITFSLRRSGNDGTEGAEEAVIPCTWVASGGDGYVRIAYEGDALDGCDAMDKLKEKDCHRWGIKFQWGDDDPITPVYGTVSVLRKIVSTQ